MCLYCAKIPAEVSERPVAEECERPVAEECERPVAEECELILELGLNSISIWGCLFSDTSFRIEHLTHKHTHTLIYTQTYKCIRIYTHVYIYVYEHVAPCFVRRRAWATQKALLIYVLSFLCICYISNIYVGSEASGRAPKPN